MDDFWEVGFEYMEEYIIANGSADLSASYVCPDGFQLGDGLSDSACRKFNGSAKKEAVGST